MKYGIVVSNFNKMITEPMLNEALRGFEERGIQPLILKVPGAAEIPYAVQDMIQKYSPDAIITLGCIIEGETDHYKAICELCTQAVKDLTLKHHTPIVFEVLMTKTYKDAEARISKGYHAVEVAIAMTNLEAENA